MHIMKKLVFLTLAFLMLPLSIEAQSKFGVRAGISTANLYKETVEESNLKIAIKEANYGVHFGIFARVFVSTRFYLQPELLVNSNSVDFEINDPGDGLFNKILKEKYQYLDIPLMLGCQLGPLRLEGGPVGHAYLASKTELDEVDKYEQRFNDFTLGYQAGIGLDIWKFLIDVRYEGNFNDFGEHMHIGGQQIDFSQSPTRWIMTIGYTF